MVSLDVERVLAAIETLSKTVAVEQNLSRCTFCGRTRWVLSLGPTG